MELVASILSSLGSMFADVSTVTCAFIWFGELECPKSLIK
jgi:cyclic lactone autoinducer peptide